MSVHGEKNGLFDALSRREYEKEDEEKTKPVLDLDPHDILGAMDIDSLVECLQVDKGEPTKKRRRQYNTVFIAPVDDTPAVVNVDSDSGRDTDFEDADGQDMPSSTPAEESETTNSG